MGTSFESLDTLKRSQKNGGRTAPKATTSRSPEGPPSPGQPAGPPDSGKGRGLERPTPPSKKGGGSDKKGKPTREASAQKSGGATVLWVGPISTATAKKISAANGCPFAVIQCTGDAPTNPCKDLADALGQEIRSRRDLQIPVIVMAFSAGGQAVKRLFLGDWSGVAGVGLMDATYTTGTADEGAKEWALMLGRAREHGFPIKITASTWPNKSYPNAQEVAISVGVLAEQLGVNDYQIWVEGFGKSIKHAEHVTKEGDNTLRWLLSKGGRYG